MGQFRKTLLFVLLKFCIVHGENLCRSYFCSFSMFPVRYPFKFDYLTPENNCTYVDLDCSIAQRATILNLPHAGGFYVKNIGYFERYIQLYDPGNCLMRRIMNFSLESSRFKANHYDNYTFFACPEESKILHSVNPIGCLSNSTSKTVAALDYSGDLMDVYGCVRVGSWLLPVQYHGNYDESFLFLTWDADACRACGEDDNSHGSDEGGSKPTAKIVAVAMSLPALMIMALSCCSVFCLHLYNMLGKRCEADLAAVPTDMVPPQTSVALSLPMPSTTTNSGLDESKIMACIEVVVLDGSDEGVPGADKTVCSICLENYGQKETISVISKCGHCFHASCIQQWLAKNGSCPVCRTSLSGVSQ